ncbi:MAG TPA: regulatory protein RecX [Candidatus Limnocylindrales bacterium]|jgi:regulatory protein
MPWKRAPGHRESFVERRERRAAIDDPEVVLNAAARFLEMRSRSVDEVRRHLGTAGYRSELVESAVARLLELGMLDDRAFGQTWVESRDRARPRGESAIRQELARKGLDRELIGEILAARRGDGAEGGAGDEAAASPDELAAERLLSKRASALLRISDPRERRNRAYALLARNGFDPEVCRRVSQHAALLDRPGGDGDGGTGLDDEP